MESILACPRCSQTFDPDQRVPLVLQCGHSLCMPCILGVCYNSAAKLECIECGSSELMTLAKAKALPPNKTLLQLCEGRTEAPLLSRLSLGSEKLPVGFLTPSKRFSTPTTTAYTRNAFTPGPSTRFMSFEDSPQHQDCRHSGCLHKQRYLPGTGMNSPYCGEHHSHVLSPLETRPFGLSDPVTSPPQSPSLKCQRGGCTNDKYCLQGQVFEYCSINCFEQDGRQRYIS
jgi:hypothetical protein